MKRISLVYIPFILVLPLIPLLPVAQSNTTQSFVISITNNEFSPDTLKVAIGDNVTFEWEIPSFGHNVVQVDDEISINYNGGFRSGPPEDAGTKFQIPTEYFTTNITLYYVCEPHAISSSMIGKIIVGEGSPESDDDKSAQLVFWIILGSFTALIAGGFIYAVKKNQQPMVVKKEIEDIGNDGNPEN